MENEVRLEEYNSILNLSSFQTNKQLKLFIILHVHMLLNLRVKKISLYFFKILINNQTMRCKKLD